MLVITDSGTHKVEGTEMTRLKELFEEYQRPVGDELKASLSALQFVPEGGHAADA